jgi:hypothetical protein
MSTPFTEDADGYRGQKVPRAYPEEEGIGVASGARATLPIVLSMESDFLSPRAWHRPPAWPPRPEAPFRVWPPLDPVRTVGATFDGFILYAQTDFLSRDDLLEMMASVEVVGREDDS